MLRNRLCAPKLACLTLAVLVHGSVFLVAVRAFRQIRFRNIPVPLPPMQLKPSLRSKDKKSRLQSASRGVACKATLAQRL